MTNLQALSNLLRDSVPRTSHGHQDRSHFWQYAPDVPAQRLDLVLGLIGEQIERGFPGNEVRYDLILFHLLRTKLTNVHGNRLWPEVALALWPRNAHWDRAEAAARFFRAHLSIHHRSRLEEITEHRRFLCLAFEQAGVGYNRLESIQKFLEYAIAALPNPLEKHSSKVLSTLVTKFTAREQGIQGLESTLLISLQAVLLVRTSLAQQRKLFASRLWTFERLCGFALAEADIDLTTVIPEARQAFLHAFRFGQHGHLTQAEAFELRLTREFKVEVPPSYPISPIGVPIGPARISTKDGGRYDVQICGANGEGADEILAAAIGATELVVGGREFEIDRAAVADRRTWGQRDSTPIYVGATVDSAALRAVLRIRRQVGPFTGGSKHTPAVGRAGHLRIRGKGDHSTDGAHVECYGEAAITSPGFGTFEVSLASEASPPDHICVLDEDDNAWDAPIAFTQGRAVFSHSDLGALGITAPGLYRLSIGRSGGPQAPILMVLGDAMIVENSRIGSIPRLHLTDSESGWRTTLTADAEVGWTPNKGIVPGRVQAEIQNSAARVVVSWTPALHDCALLIADRPIRGKISGATAWHPDAAFHSVGEPFLLMLDASENPLAKVDDCARARQVFESARSAGVEIGTLQAKPASGGPISCQWEFDIRARIGLLGCVLRREGGDVSLTCNGEADGPGANLVQVAIGYADDQLATLDMRLERNDQPAVARPFVVSLSVPSALIPLLAHANVTVLFDGRLVEIDDLQRVGIEEAQDASQERPVALRTLLLSARPLMPEPLTARILDICLRSASTLGVLPLSLDVVDGRLAAAESGARSSVMFALGRIDAYLRSVHVAPLEAIRSDLLDPAADVAFCLELLAEIAKSERGQLDPHRVRRLAGSTHSHGRTEREFLAVEAVAIAERLPPQISAEAPDILLSLRERFGFRADALAVIGRRYQQIN